jgi:hypothetical protein
MMSDLPEQMPPQPQLPAPLGNNAAMDPQLAQQAEAALQKYQGELAAWQAEGKRRSDEFEAAVALLRQDAGRGFRVDIETDSTVAADDQAEKQQAVEFISQVGTFLQQAIPAIQQNPQLAPLFCELLMFGIRRFKVGRSVEGKIQEALDKMMAAAEQAASNPQAPPDPKMIEAQGKLSILNKKVDGELALEQQRQSSEAAIEGEKAQNQREEAEAKTTVAAARLMTEVTRSAHGLV